MKTLYLTNSSENIAVDVETGDVTRLMQEDRYAVRNVYYMEEPMHVVYQYGERREEIDTKKGDVLLVFYNDIKNKYILETVRAKRWASNIKNARKIEQELKEEWAKKQSIGKGDCETNCPCENAC